MIITYLPLLAKYHVEGDDICFTVSAQEAAAHGGIDNYAEAELDRLDHILNLAESA